MALRENLTPKQDAFAMAYVETGNASEAYRRSYASEKMTARSIEVEASRMLQHPEVTLRIRSLQALAQNEHEITVAGLTGMLRDAYTSAMANKQPSAAVQATMGLAKLHGYLVEKQELSGKADTPSINVTITRTTRTTATSG